MTPETPKQTIERLKKWIDDLQSGMYINCVYCGHRYGPQDKVAASMQDALKVHVSQCPEHPMHQVLAALKSGRDLMARSHTPGGRMRDTEPHAWLELADAAIAKTEFVQPKKAKEKSMSAPAVPLELNAGEYERLRQYLVRISAMERSYLLLKIAGWFCAEGPRQEARREFWTAVEKLTVAARAADEEGKRRQD